jgi:alpha-N-arabinofuranosidase
VEIDRVIEDYTGLLAYVRGVKRSDKHIHLSFDEWNVWYKDRDGDGKWEEPPHLLEEVYNLEDALVCAQYLSSFIRHADTVKMACIAQIVNVIAPVLARKEGCLIQSTYYPFLLYSQHANGVALRPVVTTSTYKAGERGETPSVDAAASFDSTTNQLSLFLVNRNQAEAASVSVSLSDATVEKVLINQAMGGGDVKAANTWEIPDRVKPFTANATVDNGGVQIQIPAPGLAVVRCQIKGR